MACGPAPPSPPWCSVVIEGAVELEVQFEVHAEKVVAYAVDG